MGRKGPRRKGVGAPSGSKPASTKLTAKIEPLQPVEAAQTRLSGPPARPLLNALSSAESTRFEARSDAFDRVPQEYRAQVVGRSQRQYIKAQDLKIWIQEWVERVDSRSPFTTDGLRLIEARIDWRLISNSGVDEGIIRPVIGAGGWPLIPGSGIKGLFRRACPPGQLERWCGSRSSCASGDLKPGILRFHGAWPSDASWMNRLLDVTNPQQNWQMGFNNGHDKHKAFGVVSLYQPKLQVGLSCTDPSITTAEWGEVEQTLRQALRLGIGGRTCVGYGSTGALDGDLLFQCSLAGQGPAAKLLDDTAEFRPTMFRAAIRGMALRLFGALCDSTTAQQVVGKLFGSISKLEGQNVGLLATAYNDANTELGTFGRDWEQPIYATTGRLQWRLTRRCRGGEREELLLRDLLAALHGLTMSLGGFGRGWRRPDHRIFKSPDWDRHYDRTPLGCHWQWCQPDDLPRWIDVQSAEELSRLLKRARELAAQWLEDDTGMPAGKPAHWREVIDSNRMRVWMRTAADRNDAILLEWFHKDLKKTALGGQMNQVGRVWNRLLPLRAGGDSAPLTKRQASPIARPASPTARPEALARGGAMARPSASRQPASPRGEVPILMHQGPFLETVVLFPDQVEAPAFIQSMTRGKGADEGFRPVLF